MSLDLTVQREVWPIRGTFRISRGGSSETHVIVVELRDGGLVGRGECLPYRRYGESLDRVVAAIEGLRPVLRDGLDRAGLQSALPAGAARNALDCAFWDLEAKRAGKRAWELAGLAEPEPLTTAYTLSLDAPEAMGRAAHEARKRALLKLKLTGEGDLDRVAAVRANAPDARLVVDANEAWSIEQFTTYAPALKDMGVEMIEQPLPAGRDEPLADVPHPVPVCADESCHTTKSMADLNRRYDMVNIKLDKTGGLTEALRLRHAAANAGFGIMVGCMVGTSLAMAPAILAAQGAQVVDLDGPLLLARDRAGGLRYADSLVFPPEPDLWG
jgi:L-alanine-DL-glutamate epimerase-like enolase superfamily enzyme